MSVEYDDVPWPPERPTDEEVQHALEVLFGLVKRKLRDIFDHPAEKTMHARWTVDDLQVFPVLYHHQYTEQPAVFRLGLQEHMGRNHESLGRFENDASFQFEEEEAKRVFQSMPAAEKYILLNHFVCQELDYAHPRVLHESGTDADGHTSFFLPVLVEGDDASAGNDDSKLREWYEDMLKTPEIH